MFFVSWQSLVRFSKFQLFLARLVCFSGKRRSGLARVEHTTFDRPMFIGNLSTLEAKLTFVSKHSCEIVVDVFAEDLLKGVKRKTNSATLWYVCVDVEAGAIATVPPAKNLTAVIEKDAVFFFEF
jgi:acyl-CoA hydrolase